MKHARGVTRHSSMKEWLTSKPPGSGGSGKFLSGWKLKPGYVDTWLHTKCLPMTVWQHGFPMLVPVEDKQTKEKVVHVWNRKHTCHETEDVLEAMYFRETKGDPSSPRQTPPKRCGQCKLVEHLWIQSWEWLNSHDWVEKKDEEGKKVGRWVEGVYDDEGEFKPKKGAGRGLDPCARMFRFVSEAKDDENQTLHVGGMCGLFGRKELPEHLAHAMKAHKIFPKEAWKENCGVKAGSVMCVVDNDNPGNGVQISNETKELGEKVKEEITRVYKSQEIDIQRAPYCIRWEFNSGAQMGKMYTATAMMKIAPTDRILKAIRGPAPDLSQIETPFNQTQLRAYLEKHCLIKSIPWDELYPSEEQEKAWKKEDEAEEDDADGSDEEEDADGEDADDEEDEDAEGEEDDDENDASEEDEPEEDGDDEMVACDDCDKPMKASASKCPHCGKKYVVEPEAEPKPEPKKLPSRAEALAAKKAKAEGGKSKPKAEPPPQREPGDDAEEDDNQDDSIPF